MALAAAAGQWSLYRVQPPTVLYMPPRSELSATGEGAARVGRYPYHFDAFATAGQRVILPRQPMVWGVPPRAVLPRYAQENGFTRALADKAEAALAERLKRAVLVKVNAGRLADMTRILLMKRWPSRWRGSRPGGRGCKRRFSANFAAKSSPTGNG